MSNGKRYPRFPMSALVIGKVLERNLEFSGTIETISLSGIGIFTKEKLEKGMYVSLNILGFDGSNSIDDKIAGVVMNTDRQKEFGILGVQFDQVINSANHLLLYNYLVNEEKKVIAGLKSLPN